MDFPKMIIEAIVIIGCGGAIFTALIPFLNIRTKFKMIDDLTREDQLMDLRVWDYQQHGCEIEELPAPVKLQEPYKPIQTVLDRPALDRMGREMFGSRLAMNTEPQFYEETSYGGEKANEHAKLFSYGPIFENITLNKMGCSVCSKGHARVRNTRTGGYYCMKCYFDYDGSNE